MKIIKKLQKGKPINKKDLDEYYTERINDRRKGAVYNMNTREFPMVFYSTNPAAYLSLLNNNLKEQDLYYKHMDARHWISLGYSPEEAKMMAQINSKDEAEQRLNLGLDYALIKQQQDNNIPVPDGATCLYTVTDSYGSDRGVPGNLTWLATYRDKGFRKLADDEELEEADILQLGPSKNNPSHAVMFLKYLEPVEDVKGYEILGRYSDGGYTPAALKTTNWLFIPSKHNAFRFVGTAADSLRWLEDYKSKLK